MMIETKMRKVERIEKDFKPDISSDFRDTVCFVWSACRTSIRHRPHSDGGHIVRPSFIRNILNWKFVPNEIGSRKRDRPQRIVKKRCPAQAQDGSVHLTLAVIEERAGRALLFILFISFRLSDSVFGPCSIQCFQFSFSALQTLLWLNLSRWDPTEVLLSQKLRSKRTPVAAFRSDPTRIAAIETWLYSGFRS